MSASLWIKKRSISGLEYESSCKQTITVDQPVVFDDVKLQAII